MSKTRILGVVAVLAILFVLAVFAFGSRAGTASASPGMALARPSFLAAADDVSVAFIGAKLDAEAGISAWVQTGLPIDLNLIRGQFRTIETETADYIIGSVPVPNYQEHFDPHVYVHKSGWILAYYLKTDPAAKIIDTKAETIDTDKLRMVVGTLAALAGTSAENIVHYDFRYPNATHMLLVAENDDSGRDFNIQLPVGYSYNELSFGTRYGDRIYVGGERVYTLFDQDGVGYGTLTLAQLVPGSKQSIEISGYYSVIVIIHRVP